MTFFRRFSVYSIVLFQLLAYHHVNAQEVDSVPRDRIVSDAELLNLLNRNNPDISNILLLKKDGKITEAVYQLGEYLQKRNSVAYFFNPENVVSRISDFKEKYPAYAKKVIENADKFIDTYGAHPTWMMPGKDLLGRPHTPNTVRNIARQPMAAEIALSFYLEDDEKYLTYFREISRDFINSYESGKTETGGNDVFERFYAGHRLRNWLFAHYLYSASGKYTPQDFIFMLKVFLLHGAREIDVCKVFHYGNHQLHGLAALFEMSALFPEFPVMKYWNKEAQRVIMEHIEIEIKPDGFQFERASHYFKFDIINYLRIYLIARANQIILPDLFYARFHSMFDAIVALSKPDKDLPVLMDAQAKYKEYTGQDGKASFSNDVAELADPTIADLMSVATILFKSSEYKFFTGVDFSPLFYWFFHQADISVFKSVPSRTPSIGSIGLPETQYYVMRSGWGKDDLYMIIDGGLAKEKPDHTHGQQLGFIAYSHGSEILPGHRVKYSDPSYRTMKNSLVKNIALADNILLGQTWQSNHARTGFGIWKSLPVPKVNLWQSGKAYDFFSGTHNAYDSLGIKYERSIIFFKPLGWIVTDTYKSNSFHSYEQIYQGVFNIDNQYNRATADFPTKTIYILQADPTKTDIEKVQNFWTNSVQFIRPHEKNYMFNTLVMPVSKNLGFVPDIRFFERESYRQVLVFAGKDRLSLYFNKGKKIALDELQSDARIVASRYIDEKLYSVYLQNFTICTIEKYSIQAEKPGSLELIWDKAGQYKINQFSDCGNVQVKAK